MNDRWIDFRWRAPPSCEHDVFVFELVHPIHKEGSVMKRTIRFATLAFCLAALPVTALARGHPAPTPESKSQTATTSIFVTGGLNKVHAVADTTWFECSTADSSTFLDVPGMEVTFTAKRAGPVMLMFESELWGSGDCLLIRAVLNGTPVAGPGEATSLHLDGSDSYSYTYSSHGFNFMTMAVPGTNTVKIQCATHGSYEWRDLYNRSLVVLHGK